MFPWALDFRSLGVYGYKGVVLRRGRGLDGFRAL